MLDVVIVTKGDVSLQPIRNSVPNGYNIIVWDNSKGPNMGPLGQFLAACWLSSAELVYFQDDDCVTDPHAIIEAWTPGRIVCNMGTQGHRQNYENRLDKLMGFGCCFERSLIKPTLDEYLQHYAMDRVLWREPGRIFTALNSDKTYTVEVPFRNLPWAEGPDRLYKQPEHVEMAAEAIKRAMECIKWRSSLR